ncbi:helix-turn-helix domain-containing protein [Pseudomonas orientalis]|uniref:AlbA family DNA-binding domain-containing protein n=1 Tax=Pseudomonas orientalis TaxID=76758 RepID=UPI000F58CD74|nr:ATP-binding protein [Pseudomonas orientalis]AZE91632.1 hypothetical protein C4J97_4980 [Pseudomonas orientalis]
MITSDQLHALIAQGENESLELKVNTPSPDKLAIILSSMANTNGGTIVVGVREPYEIVGVGIARFNNLVEQAKGKLSGAAVIDYYSVEIDGKKLGVIQIDRAELPVSAPQGYFRRVGDQDYLLDASQIANVFASVPDQYAALSALSDTISNQSVQIEKLHKLFEKANWWGTKIFFMVIGALIAWLVRVLMPNDISTIWGWLS